MARKLVFVACLMSLVCARAFGSCSAPQNQIEAENCLPGNDSSQWSVAGAGDATIQGFATDISVNAGQTINLKIDTPASAYTIGIFRIGYYGGLGARKVASVTPSAKLPQTQPACLTDPATSLYDCGNWAISASWTVPSTAVSGVYLAVLTRTDTGGASQIIFVVRNDASTSGVVFQTADETWQAYNPYGGHSFYGGLNTFDLTNRAYKVSYNRPFNSLDLESESWFMYAEYPMVRWLEANGYDVTYLSSVDAARNGALLKNHKLYLSVGHDEYVSGPKRTAVKAARDAGVNLAFFSGNEFFWKTRWENSIDGTNTPYRTLVCYKETLGPNSNPVATAAVDPLDPPTWTGTWRDPTKSPPADGGQPENALTGQLFRVNGPGSDNTNLSIKIPAAEGKLRFWRNTQVATQSAGQTWTLPAATLGYEWDAEEDNGFRPAGLFDLSTATYTLTTDYLQDYGGLYGAGTATHKMSIYRAPSGALVFGAGTVQWSFGLDSNNGGGVTADVNMQQATANLFADMGIQPFTLQAGLQMPTQSTDTTPPSSTITSPANGATLQAGTTITVAGTAVDGGGGLVAGVEVSVNGGTTWHPATGTTSWTYTWTSTPAGTFNILSRAVDDSANLETPSAGITANIIGVTSLTLSPSTLSGGAPSQATVTLSAPAGNGGVTVTLANSNFLAATVPSSVLIPAGSNQATFNISTNTVAASTAVTITATYASTVSAILTLNPVFPPAPGIVDIDANLSTHQGTSSTTVTSGSFSTQVANELVLALISSDALQSNMTVTAVTGASLTWTMVVRTNAQGGTAEVWRAFAPSTLSNATATATFSQASPSASITILTFAGVDTSGTDGSGAIGNTASNSLAKGAPTASLTTTRNNSWVLGVGDDFSNAIARTVASNQILIDQYFTPTGDTLWSQRETAPTPTTGTSVTISDTAPTTDSFNLSLVEVRPPVVGAFGISGSVSANAANASVMLSGTMTQTVTADASGNYSFTGLIAGTYTVTPSRTGFAFSPSSQTVTISSSSLSNVNFTANPTFTISGTITPSMSGSGATVTLSGAGAATTTPDSSGNYSFSGLVNGKYTVTPSKLGFGFTPSSQNVTISGANMPNINFTATAQNFSISGNLSANGANASVALSGAASTNVTADASGNYSFTGLGNGTYTVTPAKSGYVFSPTSQTTTVSGANITGLNFTASVLATVNLAIDAKVSTDGTAASSSITSAPFSTASGNELILAFVSTDYLGGTNTSVTGVTGGGLNWTLAIRSNAQSGSSEIWKAFATAPLTNATVAAALSQSVVSNITVLSVTGADTSGAIGAVANKSAATGTPSVSLSTTRNNSWVFGVGNDYDNAVAHTPTSGQSLVHQDLTSAGDTYWVQMQNSTTPLSGTSVSISDTAPTTDRWNLAAIEVIPSQGAFGISGNISPAQAGITVSLTGTANSSTATDASGNYAFTGLGNGSYTVTPSKAGSTFSPANQPVAVNGSSVSGVNFAILAPVLTVTPRGVAFSVLQGAAAPTPGSVSITNSGGSTLIYSVTSDSAWLTATPASGSAPQTLQVNSNPNGLTPGAYLGHLTITAQGATNSPATVTARLNVTVQGDWLMVDHDTVRSGNATDESTISASNVANLKLRWSTVVDGSVTTQPLYVHSVLIGGQPRDITMVGTAGNSLFALDANTGSVIWKRNFGPSTPNNWAIPDGFGIEAPPVIDRATNRVYTVSTDGMFRTLSLIDGTDAAPAFAMITNPTTNNVWGGLNKLDKYVYIPTASNGGDVAPWRGQVYQVDVSSTPTLVGDFVVVPSIPAPNGGGGIWGYGGVSADPATGNIYAASADDSNVSTGGTEGYTPYSDSMLALNENVGLLGYYQPSQPSQYGCSGAPCDLDFASTPVIFQPAGCPTMLAAGNKNGNLYLFRASDLIASGQPLQILTLNVANDSLGNGGVGGVPAYSPSANMLFITDAGPGVTGISAGIVGFNVSASCTLQVAWSHPLSGNDFPNSTPTLANGLVYVGEGSTGIVHAYNQTTGTELWNSGTQIKSASTFAAPTIANGNLYVGSWTAYTGGGVVGAFALNAPVLSLSPTSVPFAATVGGSNPTPATVNVTNTGSGSLTFTAGSDSTWLTVSPTSGTAPQSLQLSASITGLTAGTYTGHITVASTGSQGSPATVTVTLTVSAMPTWTISGNVSANGANASVALSGAATATTSADSNGNYSFAGLANGSYTVTPTKTGYTFNPVNQPVVVNGANMPGVNFTATSNTGSGLAIDVKISKDTTAAATTIASPAFSTIAGNELILAFISTDYLSGTNTSVTGIASTGLTWTLVIRTNTQSGGSEVWRAFATTPVTNLTATATLSQSVLASMTLVSLTGVDTTGTNGSGAIGNTASANANPGAPTATLLTTRNNSWVFGVGNDYDNATARTPGSSQTVVHQDLTSTGDTYWVQMQNATTPLSGTSVTINDTALTGDRYNLSIVEVRTP